MKKKKITKKMPSILDIEGNMEYVFYTVMGLALIGCGIILFTKMGIAFCCIVLGLIVLYLMGYGLRFIIERIKDRDEFMKQNNSYMHKAINSENDETIQ